MVDSNVYCLTFSVPQTAPASVSESSGHSSNIVISTSGIFPDQPIITETLSEPNQFALILVCGCVH